MNETRFTEIAKAAAAFFEDADQAQIVGSCDAMLRHMQPDTLRTALCFLVAVTAQEMEALTGKPVQLFGIKK